MWASSRLGGRRSSGRRAVGSSDLSGRQSSGQRRPSPVPKGDFVDLFDFAVFLSILVQSSKCVRRNVTFSVRKIDSLKLGFLRDVLPSGLGGGHPMPIASRTPP